MVFTSEEFRIRWPLFEKRGWKMSELFVDRWIISAPVNYPPYTRNHAIVYYNITVDGRIILVPDWLETEWQKIQEEQELNNTSRRSGLDR
jgi:hypothetical protein